MCEERVFKLVLENGVDGCWCCYNVGVKEEIFNRVY